VCLGLPAGREFGVDLRSYTVGDRFGGMKMIPTQGVHFLVFGTDMDRTGCFVSLAPSEVAVFRWDAAVELLLPLAPAEAAPHAAAASRRQAPSHRPIDAHASRHSRPLTGRRRPVASRSTRRSARTRWALGENGPRSRSTSRPRPSPGPPSRRPRSSVPRQPKTSRPSLPGQAPPRRAAAAAAPRLKLSRLKPMWQRRPHPPLPGSGRGAAQQVAAAYQEAAYGTCPGHAMDMSIGGAAGGGASEGGSEGGGGCGGGAAAVTATARYVEVDPHALRPDGSRGVGGRRGGALTSFLLDRSEWLGWLLAHLLGTF